MACSSNQSVSLSKMTWKYDVFVSFRGEDIRNNFADHLFAAFHRKGIVAFRDDIKLKKGDHISSELLKAIEGSQILIAIFSKNYASSTWCLQELEKIAECKVLGQAVLPIFYDVSPSEVRKQSGGFEKAFMEHEDRFKGKSEEVQRWRKALKQVANLSGCDIKDKPQNAEIEKIIKEVTRLLGYKFSTLPDDIVGMDSQVEELINLMMLDSDDDVRVVGICGMSGIGKTTLARALYSRIYNQFEACCYIDDVSETYGYYGPIGVQKQLLCQTLQEEDLQICNLYMASNLIRSRLCKLKSLVVLDNVNQVEQLDKLAMKPEWLGTGSRIIIISRDSHILRVYGADEVYNVPHLDRSNALQLFCRKAFKSDDNLNGYTDLIDDALKYTSGLPLAIKALGSFLYSRDISQWRSALARLRENPRADFMDVLRTSFDGLNDTEKDIFLDIACFFDGEYETDVKRVLDIRGFHPEIGLRVLIDKSFITRRKSLIHMHDLFKELGKSIIREKSPKEPRKWNRIWDYKDFYNVISENMASENIEAIVVRDFPKNDEETEAMTTLRADGLAQMCRLKFLWLSGLNFSGSLNFLSSELEYLNWDQYPFACLPSRFESNKLVELILRHSNIKKLWEGTKPLPSLIRIDLSHSKNLIKMPSFLDVPNLERLYLEGCIKLVQIGPSIGILRRLSKLNLKDCTNLVSIPNNIFGLNSLKYLNLSGCRKLLDNKLLKMQRQIENLEMPDRKESTTQHQSTSFTVFKPSFRFSKIFRKREDSVCLLSPSSSSRLSCLQDLDISFCNLFEIPNAIGCLNSLERLNLAGNNFVRLPSSIKELSKLRYLNMEYCKQLKYFPELTVSETFCGRAEETAGLYMFDCPNLIEIESCYRMAFSWMIQQFLKVYMKSYPRIHKVEIVIPGTEIPMWFNKQNVGYWITMNPLPNMDDNNWIGVACCASFVVHVDPHRFGILDAHFFFGFHGGNRGKYSSFIPIHFRKDRVTVNLDHLCVNFYNREFIIECENYVTEGLHDIFQFSVFAVIEGLRLEVKNCGYRWIFKEDLEQLNQQMMHSGNSSVQNIMYLTND